MKWPFGKSSKSETQVITPPAPQPARPLIVTPPRPASGASPGALKKTQVIRTTEPPSPVVPTQTICLPLQSFRAQLPAGLLAADAPGDIPISLPADRIVPQLAQGKVSLPLRELVPLLPAQCIAAPPPAGSEDQSINLPMAELVAAIPAEAFQMANDAPTDLSAPEYDDLPKLFDDSFLEEIEQSLAQEKAAAAEPVATPSSPRVTDVAVSPLPPPAEPAELPARVLVKLRNLIAVMPEKLFTSPRAEIWKQTDPDSQIALDVAAILPQLATGRIRVPVRLLAAQMPTGLLTAAAASCDESVIIPMDEIIRQLPASVFAVSAKPTPAGEERVADLPEEPFAEKPVASAAAAEPAVAPMPTIAPAATEPVAEPEPPAVADEIEDDLLAASLEEPAAAAAATAPATAAPHAPLFDTEKFLAQLNRQSFDDLVKIEGISRALAKRIIEQRTALTKFTRLEEVRRIPGITRKTFEALAGASPETLNKLLHAPHDQELSLPDVVRLACGLPGVAGCLLTAADGLLLTAHLPQGLDDSRLSAFAPALFRKIRDYTEELGVGQVQRFTLFTDRQPVTIFQAGAIYLVVIHDPQHFSKALLRRLTRISEELARLCQQRAVV